jgi:hypothetical protein
VSYSVQSRSSKLCGHLGTFAATSSVILNRASLLRVLLLMMVFGSTSRSWQLTQGFSTA